MSRVARTAATKGFCFFSSMKRTMFSSTTMASSMTMPTARASASSVMILSVKPIAHIRAKVPMMDTGMASAAMTVLRQLPRKMSTITAAKTAPSTRCSLTASTLVRMDADSSRTTLSSEPDGERLLNLDEPRLDRVDDGDGVLARLLADRQHDALLAVLGGRGLGLLHAVLDPRHVADARRVVLALLDDDAADLGDVVDAPLDPQREALRAGLNLPARNAQVLLRERALHVDRGEPGGLRA